MSDRILTRSVLNVVTESSGKTFVFNTGLLKYIVLLSEAGWCCQCVTMRVMIRDFFGLTDREFKMTNAPLSSADHSKIVLFIIMMIPVTVFFAGILPSLFLIVGFIMLRRTKDFSYVDMAVRGAGIYIIIGIAISVGVVAWNAIAWDKRASYGNEFKAEMMIMFTVIGTICAIYKAALTKLLYEPLLAHKEWVELNGVFSSKAKNRETSEIDIIKGERLKSFSVADELIKWAKLKEDGHISEQEFNDARKKLLQRD